MEKELFSLYYINLEKVYELRMIRNNFIQENRVMENRLETNSHDSINAELSSGIKGIISSNIGAKSSFDSLKSVKVSDSFAVKQTKSNILSDILELADKKTDLLTSNDGELIRLDNVKLKLENEQLVRLFKVLSRDIKREISYQKSREWAKKPNIDDYIKQENYKRKHKFSTWLKSCIVKPFPTWSDDGGEVFCIVDGLIMGWMTRFISFGADFGLGIVACFMMGCILAFCFSIPSAVKAFYFKNGSKFGIFYFVAELIMLIGSIIWFCLY